MRLQGTIVKHGRQASMPKVRAVGSVPMPTTPQYQAQISRGQASKLSSVLLSTLHHYRV